MNTDITQNNIEEVLKFIPYFEKTGEEYHKFDSQLFLDPYIPSHGIIEFINSLTLNNFISSFDWPTWQNNAEDIHNDPNCFESVSIETISKLFTMYIRRDRFDGGYLDSMIEKGFVLKLLHRLKIIYNGD